MDEAVIKYYRTLLKTGFENAGSLDNPSIFLDSVGESIVYCGGALGDYVHLFINVENGTVNTIKYLCVCDPTANVAVEILCNLLKGKTLEEAAAVTEELFLQAVGSRSEDLRKKATGLLELLNRGISRYQTKTS
jgi:NifU-like protein involved in Fe-S cluster formation